MLCTSRYLADLHLQDITDRRHVNYLGISDGGQQRRHLFYGMPSHNFVHGERVQMKVFLFSLYYTRLIVSVAFGFHQTIHPLSVKWRWQHWPLRDVNGQPQPFWRTK